MNQEIKCGECGAEFDSNAALGGHVHHHRNSDSESVARDRETLIQALQEFADEIGEVPNAEQMTKNGPFSSTTFSQEFGSWNEAVESAGLAPNQYRRVPDAELQRELQRLADEFDRAPSKFEMYELGEFDDKTYRSRWGTWTEAVEAAGLEPLPPGQPEPGFTPHWEEGRAYDYGSGWDEEKRDRVRERDGYQCQDPECSITQEQHQAVYGCSLSVHHLRRPDEFSAAANANHVENLVTLCCVCHNKWEQLRPRRPDVGETDE